MIHKFQQNGLYLVLDTNSGAVHSVDQLAFRLLDYTGDPMPSQCPQAALDALSADYSPVAICECYGELYALYRDGTLYSSDGFEQYADLMGPAPVKSMCLNVAHDCNLRCEYCFAAKGDFGHGRVLMSFEVGKKAIDFLIAHSGSRHNLELDFFGGEPLMNFDVVRQVVDYARSLEQQHNKRFRFTLTTNGLLLGDDNIAYINREMSNVVLSIDGRRAVNDRLRVTGGGNGCYDTIVPRFQQLVSQRGDKDYYVRGTFTALNQDFSEDVVHLYDLGFDQISIEPVVCPASEPYAIAPKDMPAILNEYERLADRLLKIRKTGKPINFFHFMVDLDQGPCAIKRLRGCSCGNEYIAVTPEGDIYPCHQFIGIDGYKMGSVLDGSFDAALQQEFSKINIYKKDDCRQCWAKFFCSGGCSANNLQYAGDLYLPHTVSCEMTKKRLECALMMQAALAEDQ